MRVWGIFLLLVASYKFYDFQPNLRKIGVKLEM